VSLVGLFEAAMTLLNEEEMYVMKKKGMKQGQETSKLSVGMCLGVEICRVSIFLFPRGRNRTVLK
jgi:hypothetical protein